MHALSLAFFWHQHQPYYPDDVTGENPMPWVRLHGTKDYWGMAMLLKEVPEFHATVNLVPSLLLQLAAYTDHGAEDTHLRVSRLPADGLAVADVTYLLENFFMVHPDHMIRPYPRYQDLYLKRGLGVDSAAAAARRFNRRDILDLQCWSNLTWMHPLAFEQDKDLAEFRRQGQNWSEEDKAWLLKKQLQLLREIVPLHRELEAAGQIELTTTPFYHPILPMLWDKRLARQAMPDVQLPKHLDPYPADAIAQIRRGIEYHTQTFGRPPRGLWPSEGSVCQALIPALAEAGITWIATDEEILSCSTEGWVSRDAQGYLRNPELLYRPWHVDERGHSVQMIFRDHAMSDQIGFHYQRYPAEHAVEDFVGKLEAIRQATAGASGSRPPLVSIILDGENCWEYYPHGGVDFLRQLYRRIAGHPHLRAVRVGDYLERHPASDRLSRLFAGSWISHNFGIWIGHPECNRAWDLLHQTREHLLEAERGGLKSPDQLRRAREELFIAQGSDWFWWFGDSHSSAQDALFDRLFRKHLANVYALLEDPPPAELARPISQGHRHLQLHSQPTGLLNVKLDGRRTYFEWINAGHCLASGSRGTMTRVHSARLSQLHFGFDEERLFLRLDAEGGAVRERLADIDALKVVFLQPAGFELIVARPSWAQPLPQLYHAEVAVSHAGVSAAADTILEIAIPYRSLALTPDDPVHFVVELIQAEQALERLPHEGAIETTVPSTDFEMMMWQA